MDRRQIAAALTLKQLELELDLSSFDKRLILQKSIYLVQAAGLDLGYFYSWYLRGPYSSDVSKDLFPAAEELRSSNNALDGWVIDDSSKAIIEQIRDHLLKPYMQDMKALARNLELLASTHYLVKRQGIPKEPATLSQRLKQYGKEFEPTDVASALEHLDALSLT